jgi:hypothetical protein
LKSPDAVTKDERRSAKPFRNPDRLSKTTMPRWRASRFSYYGPVISAGVCRAPSRTAVFRYPADLPRHRGHDTYASTVAPRQANSRTRYRRRSVSLPRPPCRATPLCPFSRLLLLRACISLPSVCSSLPFCARCAPAKMMRNDEISRISVGAPLRANRCRELLRGRRVFVCGAWSQFGTYYMQNALYKTLHPTPFSSTERYLSALEVGMRLPPYPVLCYVLLG